MPQAKWVDSQPLTEILRSHYLNNDHTAVKDLHKHQEEKPFKCKYYELQDNYNCIRVSFRTLTHQESRIDT